MKVVDRNGNKVEFNAEKIRNAVKKVISKERLLNQITESVCVYFRTKKKPINIEEIQNVVELTLVDYECITEAHKYISYREKRKNIRVIEKLTSNDLVGDYLKRNSWKEKENANTSFCLQGLNSHIFTNITKKYWLETIYTEEIKELHDKGYIHIHDLSTLSTYCQGLDLKDLIISGIPSINGHVGAKPAKHFRSALGQIVNFLFLLQAETAGAVALSNFDTLLAPFIANDNLRYKDVLQEIQSFVFNMNVPSRVGGQSPFSNLSLDIEVPKSMLKQPVVIGGEVDDKKVYGDFQRAVDMINKAFCQVMMDGDSTGRPFTFPIPTYAIQDGFDWDNSRHDVIFELAGKFGQPYFSNFMGSDLDPDDIKSMCCRLRIDKTKLQHKGGGLFGAGALTGSTGVVTLNLSKIYSNSSKYSLTEVLKIAINSLEIKRKKLETFTENGLYPYSKFYLRNIKKKTEKYWDNHFSTIGVIGGYEASSENKYGKCNDDNIKHQFMLNTLNYINEYLKREQIKTGNMYNLEATPAESTSYSLAQKDGLGYNYYTNSTNLPVTSEMPLKEAMEYQEPLLQKYTGGSVFHIYIGNSISGSMAKAAIKTSCENFKIPYFSLAPTFSICKNHGKLHGEQVKCSICGEKTEIYKKICGYIRPISSFNVGKKMEHSERVLYKL